MDKNQQQVFDKEIVENVAKTISAYFDYPWEFMQEQGRDNIRTLAESILHMLPTPQRKVEQLLVALESAANYIDKLGGSSISYRQYISAITDRYSNKNQLAEIEKDAERYRWLRSNLGNTVSHWLCTEGGEELDEAIDFWMAKSNANN